MTSRVGDRKSPRAKTKVLRGRRGVPSVRMSIIVALCSARTAAARLPDEPPLTTRPRETSQPANADEASPVPHREIRTSMAVDALDDLSPSVEVELRPAVLRANEVVPRVGVVIEESSGEHAKAADTRGIPAR